MSQYTLMDFTPVQGSIVRILLIDDSVFVGEMQDIGCGWRAVAGWWCTTAGQVDDAVAGTDKRPKQLVSINPAHIVWEQILSRHDGAVCTQQAQEGQR